jgi:hypothetical protein
MMNITNPTIAYMRCILSLGLVKRRENEVSAPDADIKKNYCTCYIKVMQKTFFYYRSGISPKIYKKSFIKFLALFSPPTA